MHMGRTSNGKAYSLKHNARNFDISNSEHIDQERSKQNIYYTFDSTGRMQRVENFNLEEQETKLYEEFFGKHLKAQNEKYKAKRQYGYMKTVEDYLKSSKTAPQEMLLQIYKAERDVDGNFKKPTVQQLEDTQEFVKQFIKNHQRNFPNIKFLDVSIHMDEASVHAHVRCCYPAKDRNGRNVESINKCLQQMGIERPNPNKPVGRNNNAKQTYTAACRSMGQEILKLLGHEIETEPRDASQSGLTQLEYKTRQERKERERLKEENDKLVEERKNAETRENKDFFGRGKGTVTVDKEEYIALQDSYRTLEELKAEKQALREEKEDFRQEKKNFRRKEQRVDAKERQIDQIHRQDQEKIDQRDKFIQEMGLEQEFRHFTALEKQNRREKDSWER